MINRDKIAVVDVDGVLCDFWGFYQEKFGKKEGYSAEDNPAENEFWKNPPYEFWANIPRITEPEWLDRALEGYTIVFLSNCPHPSARKDWLIKNGFWKDDRIFIANPINTLKKNTLELIAPRIFIDDFGKNIKEGHEVGVPLCVKFNNKSPREEWILIKELLDKGCVNEYNGN